MNFHFYPNNFSDLIFETAKEREMNHWFYSSKTQSRSGRNEFDYAILRNLTDNGEIKS